MQVELYLGGLDQGRSLGTFEDITIVRIGDRLEVSGGDARRLMDAVARVKPSGFGSVEFSLVAEDVEYQECRVTKTGNPLHVDFMNARQL